MLSWGWRKEDLPIDLFDLEVYFFKELGWILCVWVAPEQTTFIQECAALEEDRITKQAEQTAGLEKEKPEICLHRSVVMAVEDQVL